MNIDAMAAIDWTRGRLGAAERRLLAGLPHFEGEHDRLFVHDDASARKARLPNYFAARLCSGR